MDGVRVQGHVVDVEPHAAHVLVAEDALKHIGALGSFQLAICFPLRHKSIAQSALVLTSLETSMF